MATYAKHLPPPGEVIALRSRVQELERQIATDAADRELMQQRSLRDTLAATGVGLWSWQREGDCLIWDATMCRLHGRSAPGCAAAYASEYVYADDRLNVAARWQQLLDTGLIDAGPYRIVLPDGGVRWVLSSACLTLDAQRRVIGMMGGILDITHQRMLEDKLRHAQKMESVENPTAGIAHKVLSLPTTSVSSRAETPTRPPPPGHLRVLLVDDDVAVRTAVGALLEEGGLSVAQAGSGSEALAKLTQGWVDVVLLDMSISDAPARTFIPRIKVSCPDTRVLLFSGREVPMEVARLADGVVRKPAFADELFAAIQRATGPAS